MLSMALLPHHLPPLITRTGVCPPAAMAGFRLPGALPNLPGGRKPRPAAGRATPGGLRLPRMGVGTWAWGNQLVRPPSGLVPGPSHSPAPCSFPHGRPAPGASARRSRRWASERPAADHGRPRAL